MLLSILTIFKFLVEGAIPYIEWSCYIHFLKNSKKSLPSSFISNTLNLFLASRPKNYTKKEATEAIINTPKCAPDEKEGGAR